MTHHDYRRKFQQALKAALADVKTTQKGHNAKDFINALGRANEIRNQMTAFEKTVKDLGPANAVEDISIEVQESWAKHR